MVADRGARARGGGAELESPRAGSEAGPALGLFETNVADHDCEVPEQLTIVGLLKPMAVRWSLPTVSITPPAMST